MAELESFKINVKKLYLDRGFFNTPVIRWLQALDIPFMMPAIKTGKRGGIKQFLKKRQGSRELLAGEKEQKGGFDPT
ncbi:MULTISPECIES: hypothetical protein [Nostocales]|uniref:hypothetical protein n=1 Tax=Nostocales TaxID=1161 RepID=UPI00049594E1|nr:MULTISPECIES: hypothetical protein [Nostocales]